MFLKPSPGQPLATLNLHGNLSKEPWRYPATHVSSATAINRSDDKVKNSLSTARNGINFPLGHHVPPAMSEPVLLKTLDKFKNQLLLSDDDHHRAHGGHNHKTSSRRPGGRGRKGQDTGQDAAKPGSRGGGKDEKDRGKDPEPPANGFRYPPSNEAQPQRFFACPFYATDPLQFHECSIRRLRRLSDVSQHIERCHLLQDVKLRRTHGEAAASNAVVGGTCRDPKDIKFYDPACRREFYGPTAENKYRKHQLGECQGIKTIEDTGMLLPIEFRTLLSERDRATGSVAKWYAMWRVCFPLTGLRVIPVSPYVQTIVSREQAEIVLSWASEPSQILNGIYLTTYATDPEVQAAVTYQQNMENAYAALFLPLPHVAPGSHNFLAAEH